jgi:hypothetical protein
LAGEQQGQFGPPQAHPTQDPMSSIKNGQFHRLMIARRLTNFSARIGEVPAESYEEMKCAVAETTAVILEAVINDRVDTHGKTPVRNLANAIAALQGDQSRAREDAPEIFEAVLASVSEMFQGLNACSTKRA